MKIITRIILPAAAVCAASGASAVTVESTPGFLREAVEVVADPTTETTLAVTGSVNAADFDFLRTMTALRTLDLSKATVAAYVGATTQSGLGSSPANHLPDCALMSGSFTSLSLPASITSIGMGALGHSNIEELSLPEGVTSIAPGAFSNMPRLKKATLPASVMAIGEGAFKDCTALQALEIKGSVTSLPANMLRNCEELTTVTLPATIEIIDSAAFAGCVSLRTITLPQSLRSVGPMAFSGTGLTEVDLHDVTELGDWAFAGCTHLTDVTASSLTSIGRGAFYNALALQTPVTDIVANLGQLSDYLFYGASDAGLSGLNILPLTRIGAYALSGNAASEATLPPSLTELGDHAMERWANLTTLYAHGIAEPPMLGASVWEDVDQPSVELYVDASALKKFEDAPQWREFNVKAPSASDLIETDIDTPNSIKASFDGMLLLVEATQDIRAAQLYDVAGRCFTIARNYQTNRVTLDTAPFDARVFILRLILADGSTPVLKLAR